jgi:hypothetical protein
MRDGRCYVPCIRWKQGEYLAIEHLSPVARNLILPLFEIAEIGFDFEKRKENKTVDEHLISFAKRVKEKWGTSECFVDLRHISQTARMATGEHPTTFVFKDLRSKGVSAIPVISIEQDVDNQKAVREIIRFDDRGLCIRVSLDEISQPEITELLEKQIYAINTAPKNCDFILDIDAPPNFEPLVGFAGLLKEVIKDLPHLNDWRAFAMIGTSFPSSLSGINSGISFLPRNEWLLYKELSKSLKQSNIRIPTFGDYVINHPDVLDIDMRFLKPKANIRYTLSDKWLIARGENVKDHGYGQHRDLCNWIIRSHEFYGATFSDADQYIYNCAQGNVRPGNLTTWRRVGTNHHLEVVARDVANFDVF